MSSPPDPGRPTYYELRLAGHLDPHWSSWFDGFDVNHETDGTTTLRGEVVDQAALHGLLGQVRDLGLTLLGVEAPRTTHDTKDSR